MIILHVTDFHFNKRWFDWLLEDAPPHDLVVMSGDMLDLMSVTPQRRQIEWVSAWLDGFPRPLAVCSGNHDLEWDPATERWRPAYWLRSITNPLVWTDGRRVQMDGLSVLNIGATTRPKGGSADVWAVHAPPARTLVATRFRGGDAGDLDLIESVRRFAPKLVLSGHVHSPLDWREFRDGTLFLNPGCESEAPFPNHILVNTERMSCRFVTATREDSHDSVLPAPASEDDEAAALAVA
jgi:Predicted phosphoesterases, related to the Icc protein